MDYFQCQNCYLVFKNPKVFPDQKIEFDRYQFHNNSCQDLEYINYLSQLIKPIESLIGPNFEHLDFGCGLESGFELLLRNKVKKSYLFDSYFHNENINLERTYDLITASEVVEHFQNPQNEWLKLKQMVSPNGFLAVMTMLYDDQTNFKTWWYKNDITHVVFYHQKTFSFLASLLEMNIVYNDLKKIIIFKKDR